MKTQRRDARREEEKKKTERKRNHQGVADRGGLVRGQFRNDAGAPTTGTTSLATASQNMSSLRGRD